MGRIRLMPDALANQIAAGEVVERPASVVKELVENSLDAGSRSIAIAIEGSGKDRIRVADDGIGMSAEDARLALSRHATSKLFDASDLTNISSLGFRGEALPSIASVSRFTLRTREHEADAGHEVAIEGGQLVREAPVGVPPGTIVEVERLFFNIPARRKFLRADVTEASHIAASVASLAAAYPDVGFQLEHGKRSVLEAPSVGTRRERLYQLEKSWVESAVVLEEEIGGLSIEAWLAPPPEARGAASRLHLFVNGRPVKDRILHHAVMEAYRQVSSRSGTPLVYLLLELAPDKVDVNVHPAKAEVRFIDQQFVHKAVFSAIRNALQGQRLTPEVLLVREAYEPKAEEPSMPGSTDGAALAEALFSRPAPEATPTFSELADEPPMPLGQLRASYIIAADGDSVWLIDQHAAHERILYEDLVERGVSQMGQQLLLTPIPLELTAPERVTLEEELSDLASFGYDIEPFGQGDFLLRAVPASLSGFDPIRLVRSALSERERDCRSSTVREAGSRIAARIACHAAIKVNFELAPEKMRYLVRELWRARQPTVCPHGRPTTLRIGREQIERGFGRI
ncbi:MAG TPA: DNA mismatch repair endonuclease MutL [Vicinamibacteria bacterium]|nr:DNA mismatch repair endonuclease MutL [Vicinamibacteria bacterium]